MIGLIASLIAGALYPFAFAPFYIYVVALMGVATLFFLWSRATPIRAFWQGLSFGIAVFAIGASWIFISIHRYGHASSGLSGFITALFIFILALFYGVQGYFNVKLFGHKPVWQQLLIIYPASFVLFECLRGTLLTGFPWLLLGYSQTVTPLAYYAPLVGVYGVSFLAAYIAAALALLGHRTGYFAKFIAVLVIGIIVGGGFILKHIHWTKPVGKPITASLVQGNIQPKMKWQAADIMHILKVYADLTMPLTHSKLVIWPETAIPTFPSSVQFFIDEMQQLAKQRKQTLLYGAPVMEAKTHKIYNALLSMNDSKEHYYKRHLVPFGEYIPLASWFGPLLTELKIPMSGLSAGPNLQPTLTVNGVPFSPFICYEIAYLHEVTQATRDKQFIIVITDDSWFGQSIARYQHLQITAMRALETGRYLLLASNTGITAVINPQGRVVESAPINQATVLTTQFQPMANNTPIMSTYLYYVLIGTWIGLLMIGLVL